MKARDIERRGGEGVMLRQNCTGSVQASRRRQRLGIREIYIWIVQRDSSAVNKVLVSRVVLRFTPHRWSQKSNVSSTYACGIM